MSRRKMRSLREVIDDLRAIPAEWKELDDPVSEIMKIRYGDGWGDCTTCGQPTDSADLWRATCPRCTELARIEREIGRAVIGTRILDDGITKLEADSADEYEHLKTLWEFASSKEASSRRRIRELYARYRALHAAGADAATGGEEAG